MSTQILEISVRVETRLFYSLSVNQLIELCTIEIKMVKERESYIQERLEESSTVVLGARVAGTVRVLVFSVHLPPF